MPKAKIYVGYKHGAAVEVFRAESTPTEESHGSKYAAVVGPFRTLRAAQYMMNHKVLTVAEAERLSKQ